MASFTGVGDTVSLSVPRRGEAYTVALSGTYDMQIDLQRQVGTGAWQTFKTYNTANATVSDTFTSPMENEVVRLIVVVDTSGTCTATLTAVAGEQLVKVVDTLGNTLYQIFEGGAIVPTLTPVSLAGAGDLTRAQHAFRPLLLDTAGGLDLDLPVATGSGDVYEFHVTAATTDAYEISAFDNDAAAIIQGVICGADDNAEFTWAAAATDNTVTLGGTAQATGGTIGDYLKFTDIDAGVWHCHGFIHQGGTEATPFSTDS